MKLQEEDLAAAKQRAKKQAAKKRAAAVKKKKPTRSRWKDTSESEEESDSDESVHNNRRAAHSSRKAAQRRKKHYSSSDSFDHKKKRHPTTTRQRGKAAVSYKEDSGDEKTDSEDLVDIEFNEESTQAVEEADNTETIEKIVGKRIGRKGVTGNETTIYAIEEKGIDPNEGVNGKDKDDTEDQYLIKWKGWSHLHCTWESEESLMKQKAKGMKKLENYIKREQDISSWKRIATPEDIDYFECQQELHQDLLKSYYNIERIIAQQNKEDGSTDYLCKWESLLTIVPQDSKLVFKKWQQKVEEFMDRENSK